ncbi:MAG: hypothetical protein ABI602_00760 [Candidatus Saccharibacteria bacterium]
MTNRLAVRQLSFMTSKWFLVTSGLLLGAGLVLAVRFVSYQPALIHYHANFAVYIHGQRETFKGAQYYQEVSMCSSDNGLTIPQQRAHLHDNNNSLIHVHDHAVTWGQFFENLGWYVGPNFIQTADGTTDTADAQSKLHIVINGADYTDLTPLTNTVIKDQDRLLVSFGDIDAATLSTEFKTVPSTARQADVTQDPASCSGAESVSTRQRLHHLF